MPPATFSTMMSMSCRRWPSDRCGWISLVSASTSQAWSTWPSRLNSVLASEQSPQKTPLRCRSTSRLAIASSSRSRCAGMSGGIRMSSRRYCHDRSRYRVTRMAVSSNGCTTSPAGRTAGSAQRSRSRRTRYSFVAIRCGSSLSAHSCPSVSTNRTRCRLGPTGMSRSGTSVASHSASGASQGSASSPGDPPRSRMSRPEVVTASPARFAGAWWRRLPSSLRSSVQTAPACSAQPRLGTDRLVAGRRCRRRRGYLRRLRFSRVRSSRQGQVLPAARVEQVHPGGVDPQLRRLAVADPARRVEGDDHLGTQLLTVELVFEVGELVGDLVGRLVRDERVLLGAQPLGHVDLGLEDDPAVLFVVLDEVRVREVLRTDPRDEQGPV